jgi:hypothetical protein
MSDKVFIAYVGNPDFHDGTVSRVAAEGKTALVVVKGYSGRVHVVDFEGVEEIQKNTPEGMLLYSLSEMQATSPLRKFVFTNSDDDDPRSLSVLATDFRILPQ